MAQRLDAHPALLPFSGSPSASVPFAGELQSPSSAPLPLAHGLADAFSYNPARAVNPAVSSLKNLLPQAVPRFQGRWTKVTYTPAEELTLPPGEWVQQWRRLLGIVASIRFYWGGNPPEEGAKRPKSLKSAINKAEKRWHKARSRDVFRLLLRQAKEAEQGNKVSDPKLNNRLKALIGNPRILRDVENLIFKGVDEKYLSLPQVDNLLFNTVLSGANDEFKYKFRQILIQSGHLQTISNPAMLADWYREGELLHGKDSARSRQERIQTLLAGLKNCQETKERQLEIANSDLRAAFFLPAKALFANTEPGSYTAQDIEDALRFAYRHYRFSKGKGLVTDQDVHLSDAHAEELKHDLRALFKDSPELQAQAIAAVEHLQKARDIQMDKFKRHASLNLEGAPLDRLDPNHIFTFSSMSPTQGEQMAKLVIGAMPGYYERCMTVDLSQHPDHPEQQALQDEVFRQVKPDGLYTRSHHRVFVFTNLEKSLADPKAAETRALWLSFARNSLSPEGLLVLVGSGEKGTFGLNKQKDNLFLIPTEKPLDTFLPAQGEEAALLKSFMTPRFPVQP